MIARVGHHPPHLAAVVVVDVVAALADAAPLRKYCVVVAQWGLANARSAKSVIQPRNTMRRIVLGINVPSDWMLSRASTHLRISSTPGGGGGITTTFEISERIDQLIHAQIGDDVMSLCRVLTTELQPNNLLSKMDGQVKIGYSRILRRL